MEEILPSLSLFLYSPAITSVSAAGRASRNPVCECSQMWESQPARFSERRSFPTALVPGSPPALLCLCTLLVRESRGGKGHVLQYCPTQTLTPS